ncbi:hypothetical protein HDF19_12910 [Mucilaginibacter sp. E4BP6]|uniref:hypothetical protein n=1 Tax=Mucilaginibacter sp. E4BP6 TaxID=2723089 RepID=UPI0015C9DCCB|nr:hypothetical protein [Mucilaginibacter sp. E4BP6]NYE64929.1 hypothetical protein [Mucilaginibacter sp. E4BP6]
MEELKSDKSPVDFSSLTEIMERFQSVPYEQFQQELENWFKKSLAEKGVSFADLKNSGIPNLSSLSDLVSRIYHNAELLNTLTDSSIRTEK